MPAIIQPMGVVRMATPNLRKPKDSPLSRVSSGPPMVSIMPRPILMAAMGPSRPASTNSRPPPTAAVTAVMAATLVRVAVSSGLARIQAPAAWVMLVTCWIRPRSGPFWVSSIWMLRSSHAEVMLSRSPRALSPITAAISLATPLLCCRIMAAYLAKPPAPAWPMSSAIPDAASSPKISLYAANWSALPIFSVCLATWAMMSTMLSMLPLASLVVTPRLFINLSALLVGPASWFSMARRAVPEFDP